MSYLKELKNVHSKSKVQWFNKKLIWGFFIALVIVNFGCSSDNDTITESDEYYVKYIVKSRSIYSVPITARIKSENNSNIEFSIRNGVWEMTVGPVRKKFQSSLNASYDTSQTLAQTYIDVEIHVSKNNGPFALKSNNSSTDVRMSASTSYTLN